MDRSTKRHLDLLAQQPCVVCGAHGVVIHHILEGRVKGRKSGHWTAIPLCPDCHTGSKNGIHGRQAMWKIHKLTELEALGIALERVYGKQD